MVIATITLYRDAMGQARWRHVASNGNKLSNGNQGFNSARSRNDNLQAVSRGLGGCKLFFPIQGAEVIIDLGHNDKLRIVNEG